MPIADYKTEGRAVIVLRKIAPVFDNYDAYALFLEFKALSEETKSKFVGVKYGQRQV